MRVSGLDGVGGGWFLEGAGVEGVGEGGMSRRGRRLFV